MAGYIINLDSIESLKLYTENGIYATKLSAPSGHWIPQYEATFADYATMKTGDNIYFFIKRNIYGIGELVNLSDDCKFSNFPEASEPKAFDYEDKKESLLWDEGDYSINQRWLCVFKPAPHFFSVGIDMDDVLSSNPSAFRMLRALWKVSFMKFDDEENQAFKDVILKFNQDALEDPTEGLNIFNSNFDRCHRKIMEKLGHGNYGLDSATILASCADGNSLRHEMALEAGILSQLSRRDEKTEAIFGRWSYLSHQVVASPFKPVDYMDKMDLFGYSYIKGFDPTRSKYLVAELKKGAASIDDIEQLLKYVDWVKDEYCFGDYSMINAFLVAFDFPKEIRQYKKESAKRQYTVKRRPAKSLEWNNLKLITYSFNPDAQRLDFALTE